MLSLPAKPIFTPPGLPGTAFTAPNDGMWAFCPVQSLGASSNFYLYRDSDGIGGVQLPRLVVFLAQGQSVRYFSDVSFDLAVLYLGNAFEV